jgi:hypothetical protein
MNSLKNQYKIFDDFDPETLCIESNGEYAQIQLKRVKKFLKDVQNSKETFSASIAVTNSNGEWISNIVTFDSKVERDTFIRVCNDPDKCWPSIGKKGKCYLAAETSKPIYSSWMDAMRFFGFEYDKEKCKDIQLVYPPLFA